MSARFGGDFDDFGGAWREHHVRAAREREFPDRRERVQRRRGDRAGARRAAELPREQQQCGEHNGRALHAARPNPAQHHIPAQRTVPHFPEAGEAGAAGEGRGAGHDRLHRRAQLAATDAEQSAVAAAVARLLAREQPDQSGAVAEPHLADRRLRVQRARQAGAAGAGQEPADQTDAAHVHRAAEIEFPQST